MRQALGRARSIHWGLGLVTAMVAIAWAPLATAGELVFNLDWIVFGRHAPYFVALENGFYRNAGLHIKIVRGYGGADGVNKIATKQAAFAFGDAGALIIGRSKGQPVKMVALIYGKSPMAIYTLADRKITTPKQLEGLEIAAPPFDAPRKMFPVFAKLTGIDISKVRWLSVDGGQKAPVLFSHKTDAITEFLMTQPTLNKIGAAQGLSVDTMKWADYGFDLYSNGILVSDAFIKQEPRVVGGFVKASIEGLKYSFEHPDEAVAVFRKYNPTADADIVRAEMAIVKELVLTPDAKTHGIGWIDEKKMQSSIDMVTDVFNLDRKPAPTEVFTNEFVR